MNTDRKGKKKIEVDAPSDDSALEEDLLAGIPNHVTFGNITAKIGRQARHTFPKLWSVSPAWRQALENRLVHAYRVRLQATENFIALKEYDCPTDLNIIALFSMQGKNFYHRPAIPQVAWGCECVGLAGRIYILGGIKGGFGSREVSKEVCMWDLYGQLKWKQCAQMQEGRQEFGCGVLNGKIYVFGGSTCNQTLVLGSEVYDPNSNTWSPLRPIQVNQFDHNVTTVGDELYVYGGKYYVCETRGGVKYLFDVRDAQGLNVYDPVQEKWTTPLSSDLLRQYKVAGGFFVAQGKSLSISLSHINVYDRASQLWTELHSF